MMTMGKKSAIAALAVGMLSFTAASTVAAAISVDGNSADWVAIPALITGVSGNVFGLPDFVGLRVTDDGTDIFVLYEFANATKTSSYLFIDSDLNAATGCTLGNTGLGHEFALTFNFDQRYIGASGADCGWSSLDYPGQLQAAFGATFIEASFPIAVLETLAPGLTAFHIQAGSDPSDVVGEYRLGAAPDPDPVPVPAPATLALLGIGLAGLGAARRRNAR